MPAGVSPNRTTKTVRVPNDICVAAEARAKAEGTTLSEVMVRSLRTYARGKPRVTTPKESIHGKSQRSAEST